MIKYLLLVFSICCCTVGATAQKGNFETGNQTFLLNGKPYVIRAAELHYPRIPRAYWEHRIQLCKAMGMNTICIYLFWNYHEQQEGVYDFTGEKDIAAFVKLIQKNGMYCIVRPGPYVCAEWDMGGLPWWLLKKKDLKIRALSDTFFMRSLNRYLLAVGKQLQPFQIQNGGNIIMAQVENEYSAHGNDKNYMQSIATAMKQSGFDKVQLFRCEWSNSVNNYKLPEMAITLNFGAGSNINNQFKLLKELYPQSPLMCSEYWTGWFDRWGRPHETRSVSSFIGSLKDMMDQKISFSLYMAHGGTSFGQWGGANAPPYLPMVTSYDYNAPIGEWGNTTDKFFAVRDLLKNYLNEGETLAPIPAAKPVMRLPAIRFTQSAALFSNLPKPIVSQQPLPMEMYGQGWGRILYRTQLSASATPQTLTITEVHDWASIWLNGKLIGTLDRCKNQSTIQLPPMESSAQLDILIDATGRVNFGGAIIDRKGITQKVTLGIGTSATSITNWQVYNFPVDMATQLKPNYSNKAISGPGWYQASFVVNKLADTYLDMRSWGKGMVWVNGHNLGRFWQIGPQQTLYLPGCWLKKGANQIVVFDMETPKQPTIEGLDAPILDQVTIEDSRLHRKKGDSLLLGNETPAYVGNFAPGDGWKTVTLPKSFTGRYVCLEALNSQNHNDGFTSIAELVLTDAANIPLSRQKWKVLFADSEEVAYANNGADNVFDMQESTFWHTQWGTAKPKGPHQIVIDLGETMQIGGLKYLPRTDKSTNGNIKDFRLFIKQQPFSGIATAQ